MRSKCLNANAELGWRSQRRRQPLLITAGQQHLIAHEPKLRREICSVGLRYTLRTLLILLAILPPLMWWSSGSRSSILVASGVTVSIALDQVERQFVAVSH